MEKNLAEGLKSLGNTETKYTYDKPDLSLLERFPCPFYQPDMNPRKARGSIEIKCPEFTSLCPKTGQPDFATIVIHYIPAQWCVESKALKLYLMSFRNHGEFHEACVTRICNDLVNFLEPRHLEVIGQFTPRGGIPFWPTISYWDPDAIHQV